MAWSPGERERLQQKIDKWRDENEINESNGPYGIRFSRKCRGCETDSKCPRFACIQCNNLLCGDCSGSECKICELPSTFVKIFEDSDTDRACTLCCCQAPIFRVVFADCGHTCCEACAHQMHMSAVDNGMRLACHLCQTDVESFPIFLAEVDPGEEEEWWEEEDCVAKRTRSSMKKKHNKPKK